MKRGFAQLIRAKELATLLKSGQKVHVLEVGFPASHAQHVQARIPSAKFFDVEEVADPKTSFPYMLADQDTFRKAMRQLAIPKDDSLVVCYDRSGLIPACRAWWNLKVYGRTNVAVLDGGLPQWQQIGGETQSGEYKTAEDAQTAGYDYTLDTTHYTTFQTVQVISSILRSERPQTTTQIVDVRPPARFLGLEPESTPGLRGGHIPGAINLPFTRFLTPSKTLQSKEAIVAAMKEAGVSLDDRCSAIVYCHAGVTATLGMFALMTAGKTKVSVYDGSWSEYVGASAGHASERRSGRNGGCDGNGEVNEGRPRPPAKEVVSTTLGRAVSGTAAVPLHTS